MEYTEKSMLKTSLITVGILLALLAIFLAVMSIFFPKQMSNVCLKYGFDKLAVTYAESQYNKSKDINDLHTLIYTAYQVDNNKVIIKYSEKLFASSKYDEFIVYINDLNIKSVSEEQAQIVLTNENDYLKNKYVQALCKRDSLQKAVNFALHELEKENDWAVPEKTTWMLGTILSHQSNLDNPNYDFLQMQNGENKTYLELSLIYLDKMISAYNDLKADPSSIENGEYYRNVLAYELNQYVSHITFLEDKVTLPLHDFEYYKDFRQSLTA